MSEARADILGRVRRAQRSGLQQQLQQHEILEALTDLRIPTPHSAVVTNRTDDGYAPRYG